MASGIDVIHFSFDGETAEENDALRRNGNFIRDSQNVLNFLALNDRVKIIISNVRICDREEIERHVSGTKIDIPAYISRRFEKYMDVIELASFPAMKWPGFEGGSFGSYRPTSSIKRGSAFCETAVETCTILSNGKIVPCCYDIIGNQIFGDILKDDIFALWSGKRYTAFRNATASSKPPDLCKQCIIISGEFLIKR